jgi:hypothetical protein
MLKGFEVHLRLVARESRLGADLPAVVTFGKQALNSPLRRFARVDYNF